MYRWAPEGVRADANESQALCMACLCGHADVAAMLVDAPSHPAHPDARSGEPLRLARRHGHGHVVRLLLARGASEAGAVPPSVRDVEYLCA